MKYIVYKNAEKGYYESYQDKLSDKYTKNQELAKKYRLLGAAISRLGLHERFNSIEHFLELNCTTQNLMAFKRNRVLGEVLEEDTDWSNIVFKNGLIEAIDDEGNIHDATIDVIEHLLKRPLKLRQASVFVDKTDVDFWNEYLKQ